MHAGCTRAPPRCPDARPAVWATPSFPLLLAFFGWFVLLLLGAIIVVLFLGGLQAFRAFGFGFLISSDWDPVQDVYGAAVPIFGTVITAVLALIIAVPLAFGIAFYLTELAPAWLRRPVSTAVELLAAGAVDHLRHVGVSFSSSRSWRNTSSRPLIDNLGDLPLIGFLFQGPPFGTGILTAALILAVMIIPFIAATMRDVFETVPPVFKGIRLRPGLHHLGSDALDRHSLYPCLRRRRDHAGARPSVGGNHGGDVRNREHQPDHLVIVRPRQYDRPRWLPSNFRKANPAV